MPSSEVARHYAQVLLDVAIEAGDPPEGLETLAHGLEEFAAALGGSSDLRKALASPAIPASARTRLAGAVGDRIAPGSRLSRFVSVMVARERAGELRETARAFRAALDAHRGVVEAEVVSARILSEADRASLREALAATYAGEPRLRFREDPELLGGLVIRIGNRIYDASVNRELVRFCEKYGVESR